MPVAAVTPTATAMVVGDVWTLSVLVTDADGWPVDQTPVITVTLPNASTATPTVSATAYAGVYRAEYYPATAGRHTARAVVTGYGAATWTAYADAVTATAAMPVLADLVGDRTTTYGYLGRNSWTNADVQEALDAEARAQRDRCDVPAEYPPALREALLRRVAANLARRGLPLSVAQGDAELGGTVPPPRHDPEVRRLEGPYARMSIG